MDTGELVMWFVASTAMGIVIGIFGFSLLYRKRFERMPLSTKVGCALMGAFLGVFAGILLVAGYESLESFPTNYLATSLMATTFAIGFQKFYSDLLSR